MFWRTLLFMVLVFAVMPVSVTRAAPVLDQFNFTSPGGGLEVRSNNWMAQTVTAGISGSLTKIEVWNFISYAFNPPDAPLIIEIYKTNGVTPTGTALGSVSIPISDVGTNPISDRTVADFSSFSLNFSAHDVFAIVLRTESTLPGAFDWISAHDGVTDFYTGGAAYASSDGGNTWGALHSGGSEPVDFHFWTYVEPNNASPVCSDAQAFPLVLWSPKHQFVPVLVMGVTDPDGDAVKITVTGVTQDEPVYAKSDGDISPDAVIEAGAASVRAERSGTGNGRVYQILFKAEDGNGGVCTGAVTVSVPHSMQVGLTAIDDGQNYDSTAR